jgi:hypothetical protein
MSSTPLGGVRNGHGGREHPQSILVARHVSPLTSLTRGAHCVSAYGHAVIYYLGQQCA